MSSLQQIKDYFREQGIEQPLQCDVALALLRINTPESLVEAEELLGVKITRLPPAIPPWPPRRAEVEKKVRVKRVGRSPYEPGSRADQRFRQVRTGMTADQLAARGVSRRDVQQWTARGVLELDNKEGIT